MGQKDLGNLLDTLVNSLLFFLVSVLLNSKVGFNFVLYACTHTLRLHLPDNARSPPGLQRAQMIAFCCGACAVVLFPGGVGVGSDCARAAVAGRVLGCQESAEEEAVGSVRCKGRDREACGGSAGLWGVAGACGRLGRWWWPPP